MEESGWWSNLCPSTTQGKKEKGHWLLFQVSWEMLWVVLIISLAHGAQRLYWKDIAEGNSWKEYVESKGFSNFPHFSEILSRAPTVWKLYKMREVPFLNTTTWAQNPFPISTALLQSWSFWRKNPSWLTYHKFWPWTNSLVHTDQEK